MADKIEKLSIPEPASHSSDLDKLKWVLSAKAIKEKDKKLTKDGSLLLLHFPDDIQAASAIYSIQQQTNWNPLIVNTNTGLLNGLSLRNGRPVCNWQLSGGNEQILQLFFFATAMFQKPVHSGSIMAFLSAPQLPVWKKLAARMVDIFTSKPGITNSEWKECIRNFICEIKEEDNAKQQINAIEFWIQNPRILQDNNYVVDFLNEIYSSLHKWAQQKVHSDSVDVIDQRQFLQLSALSSDLLHALKEETAFIKKTKFERFLSQLLSDSVYTIKEAQVSF